uniref:Uncharacterized protein n=1 Tax=Romanomermis culicivorax TaxID=13658 RepID=A0A915IWE0_ROMCU
MKTILEQTNFMIERPDEPTEVYPVKLGITRMFEVVPRRAGRRRFLVWIEQPSPRGDTYASDLLSKYWSNFVYTTSQGRYRNFRSKDTQHVRQISTVR